jgi:hypothetical protein
MKKFRISVTGNAWNINARDMEAAISETRKLLQDEIASLKANLPAIQALKLDSSFRVHELTNEGLLKSIYDNGKLCLIHTL